MATIKPDLPPLRTPLTAPLLGHYPSELRSPAVGTPTYIKREDVCMKTPISPPPAYLDFLAKMSPTVASPFPQSAGGPQRFFTFEKPPLTSNMSTDSIASSASSFSSGSTVSSLATVKTVDSSRAASPNAAETVQTPPTEQTSESKRKTSSPTPPPASDTPLLNAAAIAANLATASAAAAKSSPPASTPAFPTSQFANSMPAPPLSAHAVHPPPSPFAQPLSARTPRRLYIPQSPYTPGGGPVRSPMSATQCHSPFSSTMSPREWESLERVGNRIPPLSAGLIGSAAAAAAGVIPPGSAGGMNGRSIVRTIKTTTTTVHYPRGKPAQAPIVEPVPQWKKRKVGP